jgi:hypothetical protein
MIVPQFAASTKPRLKALRRILNWASVEKRVGGAVLSDLLAVRFR